MQMVHDWPEGFRLKRMDCEVGLRVESSEICSWDMFYTMRLSVLTQRSRGSDELANRAKILWNFLGWWMRLVIFIATLGGGAVHRDNEIGSLEVENQRILWFIYCWLTLCGCVDGFGGGYGYPCYSYWYGDWLGLARRWNRTGFWRRNLAKKGTGWRNVISMLSGRKIRRMLVICGI